MQPPDPDKDPLSRARQYRQQQELEERRKYGLAPLAIDTVTQQEISPNVPQSIAQAPWYYGVSGPTLAHQRAERTEDHIIVDRFDTVQQVARAKKFVAGACKNCGSRTHKANECIQAKKRIGTQYSGVVTGFDTSLQKVSKNYAQKRDRFMGDVGVDLLKGMESGKEGDVEGQPRHKPENVFAARTAQHGGVDIQELPKYLQNLDAQDELFFDPKTGSMRGNPNAHDSTKAFQGDLARYRSGDYYNYVESQHRYLTGQSNSFVDFALDDAMRLEKEEGAVPSASATTETSSAPPTPQDVLVQLLYGQSSTTAPPLHKPKDSSLPTEVVAFSSAEEPRKVLSPCASGVSVHVTLQQYCAKERATPSSGHSSVYGSYFDISCFQWGYSCCRMCNRDDSCTATQGELKDATSA